MIVLLLLLFITPSLSALRWDLMVASEGRLETLTEDGSVHALTALKPFGSLMGLALDAKSEKVYFSSQNDKDASIFEFSFTKENSSFVPIVSPQNDPVIGLAYDPISSKLFWTTGQHIMMLEMNEKSKPENGQKLPSGHTFLRFKQEEPQGIAVDGCNGFVYWTNSNNEPSIDRVRMNGTDHTRIITNGLFHPHSITIDPIERRIYWGNEREDIFFQIESSNLDGTDRRLIKRSVNNRPFSIAVNKDQVFWADWTNEAVWSVRKDGNETDVNKLYPMQARLPMGMVSNVPNAPLSQLECKAFMEAARRRKEDTTAPPATTTDAALGELADSDDVNLAAVDAVGQYCLNSGAASKTLSGLPVCRCPSGFAGARCEVSLCHNLCITGECELNSTGAAVCKCPPGFSGSRCEISACAGYCLNDGCCKIENGQPKCKCSPPFGGSRCEFNAGFSKLCRLYCERKRDMVSLDEDEEHSPCDCEEQVMGHYEYKVDGEGHHFTHMDNQTPLFSRASLAVAASLVCFCILLLACVLFLVRRVMILRKRPRIKRQFIGNKAHTNPTPLTDRPNQASDVCEISIENCCNMNICETPCFEPNLRTVRPGSKKEEKKTLLASMEQGNGPADDLY